MAVLQLDIAYALEAGFAPIDLQAEVAGVPRAPAGSVAKPATEHRGFAGTSGLATVPSGAVVTAGVAPIVLGQRCHKVNHPARLTLLGPSTEPAPVPGTTKAAG